MCCPGARKRPRSESNSSVRIHRVSPDHKAEQGTTNDSSDEDADDFSDGADYLSDSDSDSCCVSEIESEPECDTTSESPASSTSSSSSWGDPSPATHKRRRTLTQQGANTTTGTMPSDSGSACDAAAAAVVLNTRSSMAMASSHRDEIVAAVLTITSALGLTKETLHVCVDLLDRYLAQATVEPPRLERVSIACLWIAVKFIETPKTIAQKSIKLILKRRRHSGNWTWVEILEQEAVILKTLEFRVISPTVLSVLQAKIHTDGSTLTPEQVYLAYYFADLLVLRDRMTKYTKALLVDAIWFVVTGNQLADVDAALLAPVVFLFLAHRDNINPQHTAFKSWFALRCEYGPSLTAPWQVPFDPACDCRVCEHTADLRAAILPTSSVNRATSYY